MNKLSIEDARKIQKEYLTTRCSYHELSIKYKVTPNWIWCIMNGLAYGLDPIPKNKLFQSRIRKNYVKEGNVWKKKCVSCGKLKAFSPENYYLDKNGRIKYSQCKKCFIQKVIARKKRKENSG